MRARAAQGNANLRAYRKRLAFLDAHPAFKAVIERWEQILNDPVHRENSFIRDIVAKFNIYGDLSDRQLECFLQSIDRDVNAARRREENARRQAQLVAAGVTAPNGRVTVEGKVISVKLHEGAFGSQWKMVVALTSGAKVYSTVPSALLSAVGTPTELRFKGVRFTANFTPKREDPTFAFGNRPTGGELIPVPAEVAVTPTVVPEVLEGEEV